MSCWGGGNRLSSCIKGFTLAGGATHRDPAFRLSIEKKGDTFGIRRCAFTLAEVLVTLGIIGVVSAMTVPSLIQNHQKKSYVTQLHKVYNLCSQAALQVLTDRNALSLKEAGITTQADIDVFVKTYFKVIQDCSTDGTDCFAVGEYKKLDGTKVGLFESEIFNYYVLADGMSIAFYPASYGLQINMDINGKKGPNIIGRDTFAFAIYNNGVVDDFVSVSPPPFTAEQREELFTSECINPETTGWFGCLGKIINDGWEMNY